MMNKVRQKLIIRTKQITKIQTEDNTATKQWLSSKTARESYYIDSCPSPTSSSERILYPDVSQISSVQQIQSVFCYRTTDLILSSHLCSLCSFCSLLCATATTLPSHVASQSFDEELSLPTFSLLLTLFFCFIQLTSSI